MKNMLKFINSVINKNKNSYIFDYDSKVTFEDFWKRAVDFGMILKANFPEGTAKCAILCEKNINTAKALLACWYAGFIPIPLNKDYGKEAYESIINHIKPDIVIEDAYSHSEESLHIRIVDIPSEIDTNANKNTDVEELKDIALLMSTSGTSGKPKVAMIREEGLIKNIYAIAEYFKITNKDNILIARPIFHSGVLTGEFLTALYTGTNIYFTDIGFNPAGIVQSIEKLNITVICGTPTLLYNLAIYYKNRSEKNVSANINATNIEKIAISGECLTAFAAKKIREAFKETQIYHVYGLTEASPRVSFLAPEYFDQYPESVGIGISGVSIKVVDEEVYIKSESMMKGYYKDKVLTDKVMQTEASGWLKTGDVGYIDDNGLLYIKGRLDDMIIKAGMNIYPREIESKLMKVGEIKAALAYSIRNEVSEEIAIDIVPKDQYKDLTLKEWYKLISKVLPTYMLPSKINILDELNRNASGKVIPTI